MARGRRDDGAFFFLLLLWLVPATAEPQHPLQNVPSPVFPLPTSTTQPRPLAGRLPNSSPHAYFFHASRILLSPREYRSYLIIIPLCFLGSNCICPPALSPHRYPFSLVLPIHIFYCFPLTLHFRSSFAPSPLH